MTYLELKEKIEKATANKDVDSLLELFTVGNAVIVRNYNAAFKLRSAYYENLRKNVEGLGKVSDDDFEIIFNSGLSIDEKNKRLIDLGVEIQKPKTANSWSIFK